MMDLKSLARYDRFQTYRWNYEHAPDPVEVDVPPVPGSWQFCGLTVDSPLGIPAGPLLNGRWCLYYASLGFDVLTYKTVRSRQRECYPLPNLQPVACTSLWGGESELPATETMQGSWAVSYGMPSASPDIWRADVEWTRKRLPAGKLLCVSVVGTTEPDGTIDELADDYALCAKWAMESGADCIETNFSCPNVSTRDGQLYQQPADSQQVAARVRQEIGEQIPYLAKIGHLASPSEADALLQAIGGIVNALAMTNSIAAVVRGSDGRPMFDGQKRGICGDATREASITQVRLLRELIRRQDGKMELVGVGGIRTADHVLHYLDAGASATQLATAAMLQPEVGIQIRRQLGQLLAATAPSAR